MLGYFDVIVLLLYLRYILNLDFEGQIGRMLLISFLGSLIGVSMGIFVGSLGKMKEGIKIGIILGISMVCSFLSGLMNNTMKDLVEKNAPFLNRINPVEKRRIFFHQILHGVVHQSGKETADHGNAKDNSDFDALLHFSKASHENTHGNADQGAKEGNEKHPPYLSLKIQIQNIAKIEKQHDHIKVSQQKGRNLLGKDQLQLVCGRDAAPCSQGCDIGLQAYRRTKPDKASVQAGHCDQRIEKLGVSVDGPSAKGNLSKKLLTVQHLPDPCP